MLLDLWPAFMDEAAPPAQPIDGLPFRWAQAIGAAAVLERVAQDDEEFFLMFKR